MLLIGHRGAPSEEAENTIASFQRALDDGASMLEMDVRVTKDNVPIVIHDATLYRTHRLRHTVSQHTLEELQAVTTDKPIPTLEAVCDAFFGKAILNIEIKGRHTGEVIAKLVKDRYITKPSDWDNVFFSSFKVAELRATRRISKRTNLALLHNRNPFIFIAYHRWLNFSAVGFHRLYTNPLATDVAKRLGIFTYAYTVNRPQAAKRLYEQGIDGIVTDNPARLQLF